MFPYFLMRIKHNKLLSLSLPASLNRSNLSSEPSFLRKNYKLASLNKKIGNNPFFKIFIELVFLKNWHNVNNIFGR